MPLKPDLTLPEIKRKHWKSLQF